MESLVELYKIGRGPSSSHSIGPFRAVQWYLKNFTDTKKLKVTLYGSLALTGKGHMTDVSIVEAANGVPTNVIFDIKTRVDFPNSLDIEGFSSSDQLIKKVRFRSIGGGSIEIENFESPVDNKVYPEKKWNQIKKWCISNNKNLIDYVKNYDIEGYKHLSVVWEIMKKCVELGLSDREDFNFSNLLFRRKTQIIKKNIESKLTKFDIFNQKDSVFHSSLYAYAVAEMNSLHAKVVTAPTLGSAGILPGIFYYANKNLGVSDEEIINALAISGVVGNVFKSNGSIAGATGGCQAEIGVACSMGAAGFNYLLCGHNLDLIEHSAVIGIEHHLGLTCDPVGGAVISPCIERNGEVVVRCICAAYHALLTKGARNVFSLDDIVEVELKTGKDLSEGYRETSKCGLAAFYNEHYKKLKSSNK